MERTPSQFSAVSHWRISVVSTPVQPTARSASICFRGRACKLTASVIPNDFFHPRFSYARSVRVAVLDRPPVLVPGVPTRLLNALIRDELIGDAPWVSRRQVVSQISPGASGRQHVVAGVAAVQKRLLQRRAVPDVMALLCSDVLGSALDLQDVVR
eukprot:2180030-Rhodomonas_salina.3